MCNMSCPSDKEKEKKKEYFLRLRLKIKYFFKDLGKLFLFRKRIEINKRNKICEKVIVFHKENIANYTENIKKEKMDKNNKEKIKAIEKDIKEENYDIQFEQTKILSNNFELSSHCLRSKSKKSKKYFREYLDLLNSENPKEIICSFCKNVVLKEECIYTISSEFRGIKFYCLNCQKLSKIYNKFGAINEF